MSENPSEKSPPAGPCVLEVAMEMALTGEILAKIAESRGPAVAREAAMSTSVGGIGPLLRERVIAQAEQGLKVVSVSLLYETVWTQGLHGWNHLFLQRNDVGDAIREALEDTGLSFNLTFFDGTQAAVKVWKALYGQAPVYFLDCPAVADVVYPCQEDAPPRTPNPNEWADLQRLKQSWLVGRGALALCKALNVRPDLVVLSETPTLFAFPRLVQDEFQKDPLFQESRCIFNDHTPLEYAHPIWPRATLDRVRMDPALYNPFLTPHGQVDITRLLVASADGVFGVAKKHGQVMRAMPSLRDYGDKIQSVTNGVSEAIWQAPVFARAAELSDDRLIAAKEEMKASLIDWLWRRVNLWPAWKRVARGKALLLWTRRITSYKRLDMLHRVFADHALRKRFLDTQIVLIVGGRIYQRDNVSEKMVYNLVEMLNQDQELGDRIVFLDNFNAYEAPRLYQAADGAVMLADDGREASATGFMKSQMNGGLIVANADGAIPEFVFPKGQTDNPRPANGFGVAYVNREPDPQSFLKALEDFNAAYLNPAERAAMMRAAIAVTSDVSVRRTVQDTLKLYEGVLKTPAKTASAAG